MGGQRFIGPLGSNVKIKVLSFIAIALENEKARLKDMNVMTFVGTFQANFLIPDYLGIGKSVSRRFGTVKGQNLKNVSSSYL